MALRTIWTPPVTLANALMTALFELRFAQLGTRIGRFAAELRDDLGVATVYEGSQIMLPNGEVVQNNTDFSRVSPLQSLSLDLSPRESRLNALLSIPLRKDSGAFRPAIQFKSEGVNLLVGASGLSVMDTLDQVLFEVETAADLVGVGDTTGYLAEPEPILTMPPSATTLPTQESLQPYRPIVSATIDIVAQIKTCILQIPVSIAGDLDSPQIENLLNFDDGE